MQSDLTSYLEKCREYLANRTVFPVDELAKYAGEWIAWSPDGRESWRTRPTRWCSMISFGQSARIQRSVSSREFRSRIR